MAWALIALALGAYWLFLRGRLETRLGIDPRDRRRRYRFWVVKAVLLFAGPTLVALMLLGRHEALIRLPPSFAVAALRLRVPLVPVFGDSWFLATMLGGLVGGALLGAAIARFRRRRGKRQFMLGDVRSVLPVHRGELGATALLAITAGVTEELYFRLCLPLLSAAATGDARPGFAVSAVLFALAHGYQRWLGMVSAFGLALLFTAIYLMTGSLWVTMLVHALIDCNSLVLRPLLLGLPKAPRRA